MTIKVFVSSTFRDLGEHRIRAIQQLRGSGLFVDPMEDWPADTAEPTKFCPERLQECQLCILLVGFRRGYVPDQNGDGRSITQIEYDEAVRLGIDVLPYLLAEDTSDWPVEYDEREVDKQVQEWRNVLRSRAGNERFHFKTPPQSLDVLPAVIRWMQKESERERLSDYLSQIYTTHKQVRFVELPLLRQEREPEIQELFVEPWLCESLLDPSTDPTAWKCRTRLVEALVADDRQVVLGDPGSGKSILVNWIAVQLADCRHNELKNRLCNLVPLPFVLRDMGIDGTTTWDRLVETFLAKPEHRVLPRWRFDVLLKTGRAIILLDGVDEIGDVGRRTRLRDIVWTAMQVYPHTRWVVTSRIVGYDDAPFHVTYRIEDSEGGYRTDRVEYRRASLWYVAPFDDEQIAEFAGKWYAAREADKFRAAAGAVDLREAVLRDRDTRRLGRIPNLLTLMALVHRVKAVLPHGKALLYDDVAEAYLELIVTYRRLKEDSDTLRDKKRWLGRIGFEMQCTRSSDAIQTISMEGNELRRLLTIAMTETGRTLNLDDPARFVDLMQRQSGLIIEKAPDTFAFAHLSFLEYFAAVYLKERINTPSWLLGKKCIPGTGPADLPRYARQLVWQEVLVFLFELIADEAPDWRDAIRVAIFGGDWSTISEGDIGALPAAALLLRLCDDPHSKWDERQRIEAVERAISCAARVPLTTTGTREEHEAAFQGIFRQLFRGEIPQITARLQSYMAALSPARQHSIDLTETEVTDLRPLALVTELKHLQLVNVPVSDIGPLASLINLETLDLSRTMVIDLNPLSVLANLRTLSLSGTKVIDLRPLARLKLLQFLAIGGTQVVDLTPLHVLDQLSRLTFIGGTATTEDERNRLQRAMPNLRISL